MATRDKAWIGGFERMGNFLEQLQGELGQTFTITGYRTFR